MIRKGRLPDIEVIMKITQLCAKQMIAKGIYQWNEHYPNKKAFTNDVKRDELYILEFNGQVIGSVVLSDFMNEEYIPINWLSENDKNLYVHRLAIDPRHQGKGYAQKLMDFAEAFAKDNNYRSIRLDTFSQNKRNQKFYELRGYNQLDDIYFPKQSEYPFHCYELVL